MLQSASANGISAESVRYLSKITSDFYNDFLILFGLDPPANVEPMRTKLPDKSTPVLV